MIHSERRHDIDWLRALAMLATFLFHCARFFNYEDWHVKNNQLDLGMSIFVSLLVLWIMPLFFVLSGVGSYFALGFRTTGRYMSERSKRLLVPLLFGIFVVIVPLQVYLERVQHSQFTGSYLEFYPQYFSGFYGFGGNFAWMGLHLWFLEVLFVFSVISLPLFWAMGNSLGQKDGSILAGLASRPGAVFFLALPLAIVEFLVDLQPLGIGSRVMGGWSPAIYFLHFNYGYLLAGHSGIREAAERHRNSALLLGLGLSAAYVAIFYYLKFRGIQPADSHPLAYAFLGGFRVVCSWLLLVAILGHGSKHLGFSNRLLSYTKEAVLPFYILHQTVIVAIGYLLADWSAGVMVKYLILSTSALVVIISLLEAIRRVGWLRFLFGMGK